MFKKTIIAAALLGFASAGSASVLTATGVTKSSQGILSSVGVLGGSFVVVNAAATIPGGSTIQTVYSAAPTNPSLVSATIDDPGCGVGTVISYAGTTENGTVLNYTADNPANLLSAGCTTTFGVGVPPVFTKAAVEAGPVTVGASWTVVGSGVDPATYPVGNPTGALVSLQAADQFGLTVTAGASAVVDVENARETYVGAATDAITLTHTDTGGGALLDGTAATSSVITITGDFSWADNPLTAAFDVGGRQGQTPIAVTGTGGYVIGTGANGAAAPTATTLSLVDTNPTNGQTAIVTFTPLTDANLLDTDATNDVVAVSLPDTAFTASQVVTFNDEVLPVPGNGTQSVAAASAGAWTLNGASVKVFSVPFGSEVESHSIFVANSGASTGAISGSMAWNGNAPVAFDLGNVQAGANKYLNVMAALDAIGEKPPFGRADITFTVNSPAADITFTAAYNTAQGRANLYMAEQANMSTLSSAAAVSSATAATQATTAAAQATTAAAQSTTAAAQSTTAATQATTAAVSAAANSGLLSIVDTVVDRIEVDTTAVEGKVDQAILDIDVTCDNQTLIDAGTTVALVAC